MDELQKAIKTARDVHDRSEELTRTSVALGALIRAVELLAETKRCQCQWEAGDSLCDMHGQDEPESVSHPNGLIQIVANMVHARTPSTMIACQDFARAILAELALTPIEWPTEDDLSGVVFSANAAQSTASLVRSRIAPIVAAKDALILSQKREAMHLELKLASAERSIEWHRQEATAASIELGFSGSTIEEAVRKKNKAHDADKLRIVELEKHSATLEGLANQYKSERDHGEETRRIQVQRIIELEKKLAEQSPAETLRRIRDSAAEIPTHFRVGDGPKMPETAKGAIKDFVRIIDNELAKLDTATLAPNEIKVHEFIATENQILGAFFWEGGITDATPGICTQHHRTMGFNYIPRQLKLNRGDIVEIRVIERAD